MRPAATASRTPSPARTGGPYALATLAERSEDDLHTIRNGAIMVLEERGIRTDDKVEQAGDEALLALPHPKPMN